MLLMISLLLIQVSPYQSNRVNVCKTYSQTNREKVTISTTKIVYVTNHTRAQCAKGEKGDIGPDGDVKEPANFSKSLSDEIDIMNKSIEVIIQDLKREFNSTDWNETTKEIENEISNLQENLTTHLEQVLPALPGNCDDLHRSQGFTLDGIYRMVVGGKEFEAYCEFGEDGRNWMVFQRRINGEVDFYQNWKIYVKGFGKKNGEFWLGLDTLHRVTTARQYVLRIDIEDWDGNTRYAEYSVFSIGNLESRFKLTIGGYSGNAGDAMAEHNNMKFSTLDSDNDVRGDGHCAIIAHGGWWYKMCYHANLNGQYLPGGSNGQKGLIWNKWLGAKSMKTISMKIRPN